MVITMPALMIPVIIFATGVGIFLYARHVALRDCSHSTPRAK